MQRCLGNRGTFDRQVFPLSLSGRTLVPAVRRHPHTGQVLVQFQTSLCGIVCGLNGTGTDFLQVIWLSLSVSFHMCYIIIFIYTHLLTDGRRGKTGFLQKAMLLRKSWSFGHEINSASSLNHPFISVCTSRLTGNSFKYTGVVDTKTYRPTVRNT
jgi:hypothetical protein